MSVVFATITEHFIALCADKQVTNMGTGKTQMTATKVEKWSPSSEALFKVQLRMI